CRRPSKQSSLSEGVFRYGALRCSSDPTRWSPTRGDRSGVPMGRPRRRSATSPQWSVLCARERGGTIRDGPDRGSTMTRYVMLTIASVFCLVSSVLPTGSVSAQSGEDRWSDAFGEPQPWLPPGFGNGMDGVVNALCVYQGHVIAAGG